MKTIPLLFLLLLLSACAAYQGDQEFDTHENVFYTDAAIERQMGEITVPQGDGLYPAVILVHGGGWSTRSLTDTRSIANSLASNGFVVFNINYRFFPAYTHPAPIDDLDSAIKYLKKNASKYKFNSKKIGLWGYSSGGHTVTYYALTRADDANLKVDAVVSGGAPYDFTWYTHSPYIKGYIGHYRDDAFQEYIDASPVFKITSKAPPFFLYHGEKDTLVEHAQSTSFEARLKAQKIEVHRYDVSFWGHAMTFALVNGPVKEGIIFLKKRLL